MSRPHSPSTLPPLCIEGNSAAPTDTRSQDEIISQLWALYDVRGEGLVQQFEFQAVQGLVAKAIAPPSRQSSMPPIARRPSHPEEAGELRAQTRSPSLPAINRSSSQPPGSQEQQARPSPGSHGTTPHRDAAIRGGVSAKASPAVGIVARRSSAADRAWRSRGGSRPQSPARRSPSLDAYAEAAFETVDEDKDGLIGFKDFASWQTRLWNVSRTAAATKQNRLASLVQDLTQLQQADARFTTWLELAKIMKVAERLKQESDLLGAVAALETAVQHGEASLPSSDKMVDELKQRHSQWKRQHLLNCINSGTLAELESVMGDVEAAASAGHLEEGDLERARQLLVSLRPFKLHASTLSGDELHLDMCSHDTIGALREQVASGLGLKPYRVVLATANGRLTRDTATLGSCGVGPCGDTEVGVTLTAADRWLDMSVAEFFELAVALEVVSSTEAVELQKHVDSGALSVKELHAKYTCMIERTERVQCKEQEESARRQQFSKEAAQAADHVYNEACRTRRAELKEVPTASLIEMACALPRVCHGEAPQDMQADTLIERLVQDAAVERLNADSYNIYNYIYIYIYTLYVYTIYTLTHTSPLHLCYSCHRRVVS